MRRSFVSSLAILLAACSFLLVASWPGPAAAQGAAAAPQAIPLSVAHSPVGCMVAGTNPQIDAGLSPDEQVQGGRVYFHSALSGSFYYVEMTPENARYLGVLPKPRLDAGPVTYYVEGLGRDYSQTQTAEESAAVVEKAEDCKDRPVAALGPADPVRVFSVTGGTALPPGFSGVSSVVAAGTGAGTAVAAAAAGGVSGKTVAIVGVALAVGVVAVVIGTGGEENPPASPSR